MKSLSIVFALLVFAQSAFAATFPKSAKIVTAIDQPAVVVELPNIDFTDAKVINDSMVELKNPGDVKVGAITYDLAPVVFVVFHDDKNGLNVDNVKMIRYRLYSAELNAVVGDLVVDMKTGSVSSKGEKLGLVTAWY